MKKLLSNSLIATAEGVRRKDVVIEDGKILSLVDVNSFKFADRVIPCDNFFITPGFIDVHVHFREPGFSYKETIATGSDAGYVSGYSTVCTMPNVNPAPFNMENLKVQLDIIKKDAKIDVIPYGRITKDGHNLADLEEMAPYVIGFSDDGAGVQDPSVMKEAMVRAKALNKPIVAHCEDERYNTYEPESEYLQVERDIKLADETGCMYHVCHISTKESVNLIRDAKKSGVDVTCETAPHYLIFDNEKLPDEGRFKMNPPIREKKDKEALLEGFYDATIDIIATDHAPHSLEEKSKGFKDSLFGVVGLESAFPTLFTYLVKGDKKIFERLVDAMCIKPANRFKIDGGYVKEGAMANLSLVDLTTPYVIDPSIFHSKGRSCPFAGLEVRGKVTKLVRSGEIIEL